MLTINNISFKGNFRYMGGTIHSLDFIPAFEVGKDKVSQELVEFSRNSQFLNKLKEDKDVFLHHHKEIFADKKEVKTPKKGFFAGLFSFNKTEKKNPAKIGNDHLSIIFENEKAENTKNAELCEILITLPIYKETPSNIDRFGIILDNFVNINELKEKANQIFPNITHKLALIPYNESHGWCEFWKGERTSFDTVERLYVAVLERFENSAKIHYKNL